MANPTFNEKLLSRIGVNEGTEVMTISGTINKTGLLLLIAAFGSYFGWTTDNFLFAMIFFVTNIALVFAISFGPQRAQYLSQVYAFSEGYILGVISLMYANKYPGIVSNAMISTFAVLACMLGLYRYRIIQVTEKLRSVVISATLAIGLTYLIGMVMRLFGSEIPLFHESSPIGIAISVGIVLVAAFNLLLDFDMIENLSDRSAPAYMEWYSGFALLVTLVWLYLEILRLLSKLSKR